MPPAPSSLGRTLASLLPFEVTTSSRWCLCNALYGAIVNEHARVVKEVKLYRPRGRRLHPLTAR